MIGVDLKPGPWTPQSIWQLNFCCKNVFLFFLKKFEKKSWFLNGKLKLRDKGKKGEIMKLVPIIC
jgi:hypothetical protein